MRRRRCNRPADEPILRGNIPAVVPAEVEKPPFRLMDLPDVPLRRVLRNMELGPLLFLTTFRRKLIDMTVSLKLPATIDIGILSSTCYVKLSDSGRLSLEWKFSPDDIDHRELYWMDITPYTSGRRSERVLRCLQHPRIIIPNLTKVFPCSKLCLKLEMDQFSRFESIVGENDFERCSLLRLEEGSCNTQQMDRLSRTLKRVDIAYSEVDVNADVESRKWLLNSTDLNIMSPSEGWFTAEDLMSSKCTSYLIRSHQLTEQDLNQFIRKWIDNQSPQLRFMEICFMQGIRREEVLRDLDLTPYDPNRYPSHQTSEYYKRLSNFQDAYESNGRFISFNFRIFYFHLSVWHDE